MNFLYHNFFFFRRRRVLMGVIYFAVTEAIQQEGRGEERDANASSTGAAM
jgi:hypothetical protein